MQGGIDKLVIKIKGNDNGVYRHGSLNLVVPFKYQEGHVAPNCGIVVAVPTRLTTDSRKRNYDCDMVLQKGDVVYFHHNVTIQEGADMTKCFEKEQDAKYYSCDYEFIYCYERHGELFMLPDNLLVKGEAEELKEEQVLQSGLILNGKLTKDEIELTDKLLVPFNPEMRGQRYLIEQQVKEKPRVGVVYKAGEKKFSQKWMVRKGDKLLYSFDKPVPLVIDGTTYYRMKYKDILATVNKNGSLKPRGIYSMIIADKEAGTSNTIITMQEKKHCNTGRIVVGSYDERILYERSVDPEIEWNGVTYTFIETDRIVATVDADFVLGAGKTYDYTKLSL